MIRKVDLPIEGDDVEKAVTPLLREYLEHGQTAEVLVRFSFPFFSTDIKFL